MKRKLLFTLTLVLLALTTLSGFARADENAEKQERPQDKSFRVEEANLKLGKIVAGHDAVGTFIFHNDTDKDVKIIRAKPS